MMKEARHFYEVNDDDFERVFNKYIPVIYNMQARYLIRDFDGDDWLQEGRIALNDALHSYSQGHGTTFGLYYKMILENRIRSLLRRQRAQKRRAQQHAVSIEKIGFESIVEHFQYHEFVEENMYISEVLLTGEISLSSLEKHVLYYYLKGEEPEKIAKRLNETEKVVNNALNRTKNKIKKKIYSIKA